MKQTSGKQHTGKTVLCPDCGARFPRTETRCPYCGKICEEGAERSFLQDLEETRRKLDRVDDQARADYKNEWISHGRSVGKKLLILLAVFAVLAAAAFVALHDPGGGTDGDYAQEMIWQHEHFPEFDALYEAGNLQELREKIWEYGAAGHQVWDWAHYDEVTASDFEETETLP